MAPLPVESPSVDNPLAATASLTSNVPPRPRLQLLDESASQEPTKGHHTLRRFVRCTHNLLKKAQFGVDHHSKILHRSF